MKRTISILCILTLTITLFSGCKGKESEEYSSSMTIGQLKNQYQIQTVQEQNEMSPYWNVDKDATFLFHFNSTVEPALAVTVHTDPECKETSRVAQLNAAYKSESGIDVLVKPGVPVLEDSTVASWGEAPIYYLSINYDRTSSNVQKLPKPVIVPFTVKSEVSTPTTRGYIDENGQFTLSWSPIEKATSYEIYELSINDRTLMPEETKNLSSAELCYYRDDLKKIATTGDNKFTLFSEENNLKDSEGYIEKQNLFTPQTYLVKAVNKKGETSNFSTAIDSWKFDSEMPSEAKLEEITSFPNTIDVLMKSGETETMPINFKKEVEGFEEMSYRYEIPGTLLSGSVSLKKQEGQTLPEEHNSLFKPVSGIYEVGSTTSIIPDNKVKPRTKFQRKSLKLDKKRGLSTYKESTRLALINLESERISNYGVLPMSYEEFILKQGNFASNSDTAEPSKEKKLNERLEKKPVKTVNLTEEMVNPFKKKEAEEIKANQKDNSDENNASSSEKTKEDKNANTNNPTSEIKESSLIKMAVQESENEESSADKNNTQLEKNTNTEESETNTEEGEQERAIEENVEIKEEMIEEPSQEIDINAPRPENPFIDEADNYPVPDVQFRLFVKTAEEEYIARMLMMALPEIDLKGFPTLQNPEYFDKVIQEVVLQNPYIMGVSSYTLNHKDNTVSIEYALEPNQIYNRQKEANAMVTTLLSASVREGMTEEERALAVYNKLEDETIFDSEAYDKLAKAGFRGIQEDSKDSFNIYGLLCKKKGLAHTYTQAHKLLLVDSKVKTETIYGTAFGKKHSWNVSSIGDKWYWYDASTNGKNSNTPYILYQNGTEYAKELGYKVKSDNNFDAYLLSQEDNNKNYYQKHNLILNKKEDLINKILLARKEMNRNGVYSIYTKEKMNDAEITEELLFDIKKKLEENDVKEAERTNLKIGITKNLLIFNENAE